MRPAMHANPNIKSNWWYLVTQCFFFIIMGLTLKSGAQSFQSNNISIEPGGNLWIEGSASVTDYKCEAKKLSGAGRIQNIENPSLNIQEDGSVRIFVKLPVQTLDCGKRAMNRDMYNALKAESHPEISYQLLEAGLAEGDSADMDGWMNIRTQGIMEIAGVTDTTEIFVQGKLLEDNRFRVRGSKDIHMDTYNIKPPTALFGLIRAEKDLTVHFDVTVRLND